MLTTEALRAAVAAGGDDVVVTLDPRFQGLPDTAHGGSVLAVFDLLAARPGPRALRGQYLRRVPLGVPLRLRRRPDADDSVFELSDTTTLLVHGGVGKAGGAPPPVAPPAPEALALPVSRGCFACGTDNALGLRAQLRADDVAVGGTWTPRAGFEAAGGVLAPIALTTLLDEAAFWLGALATGESGMTTELAVTLHAAPSADTVITVTGARAAVRPRVGDARYWDTVLAARDADGRLVASAAITFVAVRGAARRLVTGMLSINAPALVHRVFPAYAPPN